MYRKKGTPGTNRDEVSFLEKDEMTRLAKKAKRGNAKAYGMLIESLKEYLYKTAMLSAKNEQVALDVVSECILNGYQKIKQLDKPEYFKTWITRILFHIIADYYRSEKYTEDVDSLQIPEPESIVNKEEKMDLYQAIDMLSEKYRKVIILKYFDGLKISDIAYVMDIPEGSVKAYLHRAKEDLKHLLTEVDLYEDGFRKNRSIG